MPLDLLAALRAFRPPAESLARMQTPDQAIQKAPDDQAEEEDENNYYI